MSREQAKSPILESSYGSRIPLCDQVRLEHILQKLAEVDVELYGVRCWATGPCVHDLMGALTDIGNATGAIEDALRAARRPDEKEKQEG